MEASQYTLLAIDIMSLNVPCCSSLALLTVVAASSHKAPSPFLPTSQQ